MKKVLKQVVSMLLAMILVLGVWQTPVYASGIDDNGQGNCYTAVYDGRIYNCS